MGGGATDAVILKCLSPLNIKKTHSGQDVNRQMRFNQWQDYDE
ncbi:Uncharacterized protein BN1183_CH_01790 [Pantoea ananatis]|nr:Uncharacterized protein BN1183_CH_01790 [Pantoea ananatis]